MLAVFLFVSKFWTLSLLMLYVLIVNYYHAKK